MTAYLLVTHGSRHPRPQTEVEGLAQLVQQQLSQTPALAIAQPTSIRHPAAPSNPPLIGTAVLELHPDPLHEQIRQFAERAIAHHHHQIKLLPLFLLPGVHVMEDIPSEVAIARSHLPAHVTLDVCPYLGSHPRLKTLLLSSDPHSQQNLILLSHGSRRPGANLPVEAIAHELNALPAYWSVTPTLQDQVFRLIKQGSQNIHVLPYFLFPGGIIDALSQTLEQLIQQFPYVQLKMSPPLGASPAMAELVIELAN